nr:hypothetical protein CFP56_36392 [Quercus suber]
MSSLVNSRDGQPDVCDSNTTERDMSVVLNVRHERMKLSPSARREQAGGKEYLDDQPPPHPPFNPSLPLQHIFRRAALILTPPDPSPRRAPDPTRPQASRGPQHPDRVPPSLRGPARVVAAEAHAADDAARLAAGADAAGRARRHRRATASAGVQRAPVRHGLRARDARRRRGVPRHRLLGLAGRLDVEARLLERGPRRRDPGARRLGAPLAVGAAGARDRAGRARRHPAPDHGVRGGWREPACVAECGGAGLRVCAGDPGVRGVLAGGGGWGRSGGGGGRIWADELGGGFRGWEWREAVRGMLAWLPRGLGCRGWAGRRFTGWISPQDGARCTTCESHDDRA